MSSAFKSATVSARLQVIVDSVGANAQIKLYNGSRPASGGTISGQTLIAELVCGATLGTVSGSALTFNTITQDSSANATGTPTWCRILRSDGVTWEADFDLSSFPACTSGQPVSITSFVVNENNT